MARIIKTGKGYYLSGAAKANPLSRSGRTALIVGGVAVVAGAAVAVWYFSQPSTPPPSQCNPPCDQNHVCVQGQCTGGRCDIDSDCPPGQYCSNGRCAINPGNTNLCQDRVCPPFTHCDPATGQCVPNGGPSIKLNYAINKGSYRV